MTIRIKMKRFREDIRVVGQEVLFVRKQQTFLPVTE